MKRFFPLLAAAFLCATVLAQKSAVEQIGAKVRRIDDDLRKYARTQQTFTDETTEGGQVTFYALACDAGRELKKAIVEAYGEMGKTQTALYYDRGELIFASRTTIRYQRPISIDPQPPVASTVSERFYFEGGKLLEHAFTEGTDQTLQPEEAARQILALSQRVRAAFSRKPEDASAMRNFHRCSSPVKIAPLSVSS